MPKSIEEMKVAEKIQQGNREKLWKSNLSVGQSVIQLQVESGSCLQVATIKRDAYLL